MKNVTNVIPNTKPVIKTAGILKGDGQGGVSAAVPGVDYLDQSVAPSIGTNGNWFLGKEDTGVKASGQSTTEILPVTISPENWDAATNQVIIDCEGVSINEEEQVVTLSPALNSKATCTACEIKCVECNNDNLTLQATTLPTEAVTIYVAITKAGGSQSSGATSDVYSTEETVVGTWIDGKPIYRKTILATLQDGLNLTNSGNVEALISEQGVVHLSNSLGVEHIATPFTMSNNNRVYTHLVAGQTDITLVCTGYTGSITVTVEYTKTTDTATIEIPSATAMAASYDEGVNEA